LDKAVTASTAYKRWRSVPLALDEAVAVFPQPLLGVHIQHAAVQHDHISPRKGFSGMPLPARMDISII
jgi:hypothetical protein